jgi:hypothetical protein
MIDQSFDSTSISFSGIPFTGHMLQDLASSGKISSLDSIQLKKDLLLTGVDTIS